MCSIRNHKRCFQLGSAKHYSVHIKVYFKSIILFVLCLIMYLNYLFIILFTAFHVVTSNYFHSKLMVYVVIHVIKKYKFC